MGNNTKNTIEINGKRYDAVSGTMLGDAVVPSSTRTKTAKRSVDGFTKAARTAAGATPTTQATGAPSAPALTPVKRVAHTPASHIAPHKPARSSTLMRSAVKKPDLKAPKLSAQSRTDVLVKNSNQALQPKLSHTSIDPKRQKRAKQVIQSPAVSRYGNVSTVDKLTASVSSLAAYSSVSASGSLQSAPTPKGLRVSQSNAATPTIPVRPVHHVTKQPDIFEQALARSAASEQSDRKATHGTKKRNRFMAVATTSLVVISALGVFAYFNVPSLSMRLASSRAGFEARLPHYSPAGFSFGKLSYSPGNVVLNYKAGDNDTRNFNIIQRVSNWDSETLLSNFVTTSASAYQTYERAGRTVYIYGNNSATWVDSGVWYIIDGSDSLTKGQILDLAGSL